MTTGISLFACPSHLSWRELFPSVTFNAWVRLTGPAIYSPSAFTTVAVRTSPAFHTPMHDNLLCYPFTTNHPTFWALTAQVKQCDCLDPLSFIAADRSHLPAHSYHGPLLCLQLVPSRWCSHYLRLLFLHSFCQIACPYLRHSSVDCGIELNSHLDHNRSI